jgi:hypothetical protein
VSQVQIMDEGMGPDGVVLVPVGGLSSRSPFRLGGTCPEQVERLVELGGTWPPILVARDGVVIDGCHRVAAARRLGMARIAAVYFDGGPEEAFVEFVRRNVAHGLMLTLVERKQAATRVLDLHPDWSDRRIAELCALSPKTVGRLRLSVVGSAPGEQRADEVREGRDHRLRPARPGSVRGRVVEALREQPDASLRTIAAVAGASPETVRLVRMNLAADPVIECRVAPPGEPSGPDGPAGGDDAIDWASDAALASAPGGDDLLTWMAQTRLDPSDLEWAQSVPLSRVYVLAEESRRRSDLWLQFAQALEARPLRAR